MQVISGMKSSMKNDLMGKILSGGSTCLCSYRQKCVKRLVNRRVAELAEDVCPLP